MKKSRRRNKHRKSWLLFQYIICILGYYHYDDSLDCL